MVALCIVAVSSRDLSGPCQLRGEELGQSSYRLAAQDSENAEPCIAVSSDPPIRLVRADESSPISACSELQGLLAIESASIEKAPNAVVENLLAHPASLYALPRQTILRLYQAYRIACPGNAPHLLGNWAQMHPGGEAYFGLGTENMICGEYCRVADSMVRHNPSHLVVLEREYLVLPGGGCCLPAAYILATSYSMNGRIEEWIEKLDLRLMGSKIKGDQRASWLLARAWTEEIRFVTAASDQYPAHHSLAGRRWLEEATMLVGLSEAVRLRAYEELVVRLSVEEQFDAAGKLLERARCRCTSSASVRSLASWQQEIDHLIRAEAQTRHIRRTAAEKAYWNGIKVRYREAIRSGDHEEFSRYKEALDQAGIKP
jgi:hypothetical protein